MPKTPDARPQTYHLQGDLKATGKQVKLDLGREVLRAVIEEGGILRDEYGRASRKLCDRLGYLPTEQTLAAISKSVQELAKAGLVDRELRARRTYEIKSLLDRVPDEGECDTSHHIVVVPVDPNEPAPVQTYKKKRRSVTRVPDKSVKRHELKFGGTVYGYEDRVFVANEILRVVAEQGGMVVDDGGYVNRRLADLLGYAQTKRSLDAIGSSLEELVKEGMIDRDVRGKRTYGVIGPETRQELSHPASRLVTVKAEPEPERDGNLDDSVQGFLPEADQGVRVPLQEVTSEPDYDQLAAALLRRVVEKVSREGDDESERERLHTLVEDLNKQVSDLEEALQHTKNTLRQTNEQLDATKAERDQVRHELKETKEKLHRASNNARVFQQQLERKGNTHRVGETLDDESKKRLDQLMRELPNG